MEAIIFIGIQGAGKSTFFQKFFADTHIRINLDMLKTRNRENIIFHACLQAKQRFVIDNTNPTKEDRQRYITPAKLHNFQVIGYYFDVQLTECQQRNNQRSPKQIIPLPGILSTFKKLTPPIFAEGFDIIYSVKNDLNQSFIIEEWKHEI